MTGTVTPETETDTATHDRSSGLRKVASISASLVGTYAVTSALGLVFWLLAAREFPIASVGVAGAAVSAMLLLGTLGTCGLGTLLISRLPQTHPGARRVLVRTALTVAGAGGLVLAVVVPATATWVLGLSDMRSIAGTPATAALFAVGTALTAASIVIDQAVLVIDNGSLQLERNTVASVVKLVVLLGLVVGGASDGMAIFLAWSVGTAVSLPLVAWRTRGGRGHADGGRLVDLTTLRGLAGQAVSHHSLNTALQAPIQLLPLVVLIGLSAAGNGVFSTAMQVSGAVFALPFAIAVALFASSRGSERHVVDRMRLTLPLSLGISAAANLVLFPFAGLVLSVFGAQYSSQGFEVLRILALAGLPIVVKDHFVALRRVQGRTTEATLVMVAMAVLELLAAGVGLRVDGLVGLCAWWLGAVVLEAVVLSVPLLAAVRRYRTLDRIEAARFEYVDVVDRQPSPATRPAREKTLRTAVPAEPGPRSVDSGDDRLPLHLVDAPDISASPDLEPTWSRRLLRAVGPGPVLLLMTIGLLPITRAVTHSRDSGSGSTGTDQALYLAGLVLILLPAAVGVLLPRVAASTRVALSLGAMVLLQVSRFVVEPTRFVDHNELIFLTGLRQTEQTGRLYGDNSLLPVTSYYPGLQVATDAVRDLTGLGNHASGIVVLLAARVVMALGVLLVVTWVTRSTRVGAFAVVVYACNPQNVVFNATFSYQTLALPLAVLVVHLVLTRRRGSRLALVPAVLALWAVILTHHLTSWLLIAFFVGWAVVEVGLRGRRSRSLPALAVMVTTGVAGVVVSVLNPGNPVLSYLAQIGDSAVTSIQQVLDTGKSRQLFQNSAGVQTAPWERDAILAALAITLLALVASLWRARRLVAARNSLVVVLLLIALVFPVIPAGHLTSATAEVGDRAAGFVFLGVAFVVAWAVWQWPVRSWRAWATGVVVAVVFVGNLILGAGSISNQLPGPFRVSDDDRSADADNLAAADWMATHLPSNSVVYGDRIGVLLAGAYGDQLAVTHIGSGVDASRLLLAPGFGRDDVALIRQTHIRYLVVDRRDANGLPNLGVYIESGEYGEQGRTSPVSAKALRKFSSVRGVKEIYDNGSVVIYDLEAIDDH